MMRNGYNNQPASTRKGCTLKRITLGFLIVIVFIGIVSLVTIFFLWFFYRPHLPEFRVDSFSLKNFTAVSNGSSKVSFAADIALTARNPNRKLDLGVARSDAIVYYKTKTLASTDIKPFSMGTERKFPLNPSFAANAADVGGINNANVASFELWLFTNLRYNKIGSRNNRNNILKVFCPDLAVGLPSSDGKPGALTGGPKRCRVGLSNKRPQDPDF